MTFQYVRETGDIVDPDDGAVLRTISSHPHATSGTVGIFDRYGKQQFWAKFRSYSIDLPREAQEIDPLGQIALLACGALDEAGRSTSVLSSHPDLDRLVEYYRTSLEAKTNVDKFVFLDLRERDRA